MFPLAKRQLIRGCSAHVAAGLGCGADYTAVYDGFKIPFDGVARRYHGSEGGNWLRITRANGDRIELAHLSAYLVSNGNVREGQNGGITGNTGSITTGPHLHIQIFNKAGVRLDPEKYNWEGRVKMELINDNGTVYLVTGNKDKRKIGIADLKSLGLFGDEPQRVGDTTKIPQYNTIEEGTTITHK